MAGNASNWHKPTYGRYKGKAVYVSMATLRATDSPQAKLIDILASRQQIPTSLVIQRYIEAGSIKPQTPPTGVAQSGGALIPGRQDGGGTPTAHASSLTDRQAIRIFGSEQDFPNTSGGDKRLGAIYAVQGYNAKPDVLTSKQIDGYVRAGEIEIFRGTLGDGNSRDVWSEAYRSAPQHFPGHGVSGNGTYVAEDPATAANYATNRGTVLRMTLKADAKIGEYDKLSEQRYMDLEAMKASPQYMVYENAKRQVLNERRKLPVAMTKAEKAANNAAIDQLGKRYDRITARQEREYPQRSFYSDMGAYAAARGYDAIRVNRGGPGSDFYVVLNRGATRVQDTSLLPENMS